MSRENYFELLKKQGFNAETEIERLINFLKTPYYYNVTLMNDIETLFLDYKNRGSFLTFQELMDYVASKSDNADNLLFHFTEMIIDIKENLLRPYIKELFSDRDTKYEFIVDHLRALDRQIKDYLNRSNHELVKNSEGQALVVIRNASSTEAANIISDDDHTIALKILEYNHFSNQGNVVNKRSILIDLGRYFEPKRDYLKQHFEGDIFKGGKNPLIISRIFEMLNKLQIRHQDEYQYISLEDEKVLEKWYDATYNTFIFIIISSIQLKLNEEFDSLKNH